jgi:hypothetical protein
VSLEEEIVPLEEEKENPMEKAIEFFSRMDLQNIVDGLQFLCHNCSNIDSPSGEACHLVACYPYNDKEKILHGAIPCFQYEGFKSDFYLVEKGSFGDINLKEMDENPLWEVNFYMWALSAEELAEYRREEELREEEEIRAACALKARAEMKERLFIHDLMYNARPCRLDEDPILSMPKWVQE